MLVSRRDLYSIKIILKKRNISAVMEIEYILNQFNLNSDGQYYFKIKEITDLTTSELIQDQSQKTEIAEVLVKLFNENSTNFLGKTATEISLNF